jgi:hypothetical protein
MTVSPRIGVALALRLAVGACRGSSVLFIGRVEYELQCQATPQRLATIEAACRKAIATLTRSSAS